MSKKQSASPRLGQWILSLLMRYEHEFSITGDISEEYRLRLQSQGSLKALLWYWREILTALSTYVRLAVSASVTMLLNYTKISLRNLKKQKTHSLISLSGLAVGMAGFILISLYVHHEFSYDRYHLDSDRIFRVVVHTKFYTMQTIAQTSDLTIPEIRDNFPQVEAAARIYNRKGIAIKKGSDVFYDDRVVFAEPEIFQILTIPVLSGDSASLSAPGAALLSETLAQKLFGTATVFGKTVEINDSSYSVAGVVADPPTNGHLQYSCLVSHVSLKKETNRDWTRFDTGSYIKLKPLTDTEEFEKRLGPLTAKYLPVAQGEERKQTYLLQPVKDIHLTRGLLFDDDFIHGNRLFLYLLSGLSLVILILACVNFINLATACSATRFREVGMRKVIGAQKRQLVFQFLGESCLLAGLAFLLALLIVIVVLPGFSVLAGIPFGMRHLFLGNLIALWLGLIFFVGIAAGLYPALFLSSFKPIHILSKKTALNSGSGGVIRRILFIGQFSVSILLVIAMITMNQQIRFMKDYPLGFEKEQKLVVQIPRTRSQSVDNSVLKYELLNSSLIESASFSSGVPGRGLNYAGTRRSDIQWEKSKRVYHIFADEDFVDYFQIKWATSPLSHEALSSVMEKGVIVNEKLVYDFGWKTPDDALGQRIHSGNIGEEREIVGVVRDFHFKGLYDPVEPLIISGASQAFRLITLTVDTRSLPEITAFLKTKWDTFFPGYPLEYFFLDENFNQAYQQDEQVFTIVSAFSLLGITIACFGLFGLTTFMAERRTKEIGIRKILGSSTAGIVNLLYREYSAGVVIANLIAWPAAFFIMNRWLQKFHFRIGMDFGIFLSAGVISLVLVLLTVSYQAWKAAHADPIDSLRYE